MSKRGSGKIITNQVLSNGKNRKLGISIGFVLIVICLFSNSNRASACSNPTDSFAFEVLLNKPGITYDVYPLINAENVGIKTKELPISGEELLEPQEEVIAYKNDTTVVITTTAKEPQETESVIEAIVYRSHYNDDIAVVLSEVETPFNLKGLSVRLQVPTKFVNISYPRTTMVIERSNLLSVDEEVLKSLGYEVEGEIEGQLKGIIWRKGTVVITVWNITTDYEVHNGMPNHDLKELPNNGMRVAITNETLTPELEEELQTIALSMGISETEWNNAIIETRTIDDIDLEPIHDNLEEFDFQAGIKAELEWLRETKLLSGLSDSDIQQISQLGRAGLAGYNSRIVWANGWKPYYETENPRQLGISCEGFSVENLPEGEPLLALPEVAVAGTLVAVAGTVMLMLLTLNRKR